jgi:hypothetical protein
MNRDDVRDQRDPAQGVVEALTDLFDSVAPSDRAGAEEELREAGVDPATVALRIGQRATNTIRGTETRPARDTRHPAGARRRAPAPPISESRRWRAGGSWGRAVAALLLGIAIGWLLARSATAPPPREAQLARGPHANAGEPSPPAAGWHTRADAPARAREEHVSDAGTTGGRQSDEVLGAARRAEPAAGTGNAPAAGGATHTDVALNAGGGPGVSESEEAAAEDEAAAGSGDSTEPWLLDARNWSKGKHLLPAPLLQHVRTGDYHFTVQPLTPGVFRRSYSRDFWTESAANAGRFGIDADTCGLKDATRGDVPSFFFGFPFPDVAREDPAAGCQIMWNAVAASAIGGGQETELNMDQFAAGSAAPDRRVQVQLYDRTFLGRQSGPIPNPDGLRSATLAQVKAPAELMGTAVLTRRSNQATERDHIWTYLPSLRRVRAVSPANRSDGFLGTDLSLDELDCFDGKLEDFDWHVVGRQTILAPLTSVRPSTQVMLTEARTQVALPSPRAAFEVESAAGAPWLMVDGLVTAPRPVWVVEGIPRDKYYLFGKIVLYVDQELYRTYWRLAYGWQGEYRGHTMCAQHWSRSVDAIFASVTANALTAVNETTHRATLGRFTSQILDEAQRDDLFTLSGPIQSAH